MHDRIGRHTDAQAGRHDRATLNVHGRMFGELGDYQLFDCREHNDQKLPHTGLFVECMLTKLYPKLETFRLEVRRVSMYI